ncbi:MAG: 6-hydroxymethylpterin diphosphokinase MptE-like protein [Pseudomonadota bacterium]
MQLSLFDQGRYPAIVANGIRLASAWEPQAEAQLQLQHIDTDSSAVTIFGIGMGYLPISALNTFRNLQQLTVVPLNLCLFSRMADYIDMSAWLQDSRVTLTLPHSCASLPADFAVSTADLSLVESSAEQLRDLIRQSLALEHSNAFQRGRDKLIQSNIRKNLSVSGHNEDVALLFGTRSAQHTAIVVGAGPSLDQCIANIRQSQQQGAKLFAVDAALQALHRHHLVPDYVVAIDPLETVQEFLNVTKATHKRCSLVYFPSAHPQAVANWPGRRYYACASHERFDHFRTKKAASTLFSSGSVIHPATDLAVRSGCGHIVFAGADFGYPLEHTHADGVSVSAPATVAANSPHSVRNYRDELIPSSMNLISYYRDLEQYINAVPSTHVRFSNLGLLSAKMARVSPISPDVSNDY